MRWKPGRETLSTAPLRSGSRMGWRADFKTSKAFSIASAATCQSRPGSVMVKVPGPRRVPGAWLGPGHICGSVDLPGLAHRLPQLGGREARVFDDVQDHLLAPGGEVDCGRQLL